MRRIALLVVTLVFAAAAARKPEGIWRGESACVVRPSACRDEDALYRVSAGGTPDRLRVSGGKIVDGREVSMSALADLTGPGIDTPITISPVPGHQFTLPSLHQPGDYALQKTSVS